MNSTIWKQTDSRWASKAYPKGSTVGGCGCGLLACTHVAMEQESKKNWTPDNLRAWMVGKGFALRGQGTRWEGITETLKYIGHKNVVRIYNDPMSCAWKELNKGNRIGVLLFHSHKAPNGIRWTSSGHYVAFTGYKVEGGKHYFYTKDSGGRNHSGWYSYENSMKGCIAKVWIVERVGAQTNGSATVAAAASASVSATTYKPSGAYTGKLPTSVVKNKSKGASVKAVQQFLNWCINAKLSVDSVAGPKTVSAIKVYQKTYGLTVDGIFGSGSKAKAQSIINQYKPKTTPKVKTRGDKIAETAESLVGKVKYVSGGTNIKTGVDCTGFVQHCYKVNGITMSNKLSAWGKSIGTNASKAQPGDIFTYKNKTGIHHAIYVGGGKVVHAANKREGVKKSKWNSMSRPLVGIRRRWK